MKETGHQKIFEISPLGIEIAFCTNPGGYHPSHWHEELEILYPLNGEADIIVENKKYRLPKKHATVVESCKIHSTFSYDSSEMFLRIYVSKECLQNYIPDIELCRIHCIPEDISKELFPEYYKICELLAELTRLYIYDMPYFRLEAEGIVLQAVACLVRFFSSSAAPQAAADPLTMERLRSVIRYVEQHYQEKILLQDVASHLGISREYFCRIFKKNIGSPFLQYLNDFRLSKAYADLQSTSLPVSEIMEKNGIAGQKQFNQSFKKRYGCTPSSVRSAKNIQEPE